MRLKVFFPIFIMLLVTSFAFAYEQNTVSNNYTYEQEYQIKKNYRLKMESAIKTALANNQYRAFSNVILNGSFSPSGKLINLKFLQSSGNKKTDDVIISALQSLSAFGTIQPKEFMPDMFALSLLVPPKYSNSAFTLVLELFENSVGTPPKLEWNAYLRGVESAVQSKWNPKNMNNKTLKVVILRFYIKKTGKVDDVVILKSSDDMAFDNLAVQAIKNSSFMPLPDGVLEDSKAIDYSLSNINYVANPSNNTQQKKSFWENFSNLNNDYYQKYKNPNPWM